MTPFGRQLEHSLRVERERMLNEWFFKWHFIGRDGPVEIDRFDGRKISYGGIKFSGTARDVYWSTLNRYARVKIDEVFQSLEQSVSTYPHKQAIAAIEDAQRLLIAFLAQIANDAVEKDRILRGNGTDFPQPDRGSGGKVLLMGEVRARAAALNSHFEAVHLAKTANPSKDSNREILVLRPSLWGIGIDLRSLWKRFSPFHT